MDRVETNETVDVMIRHAVPGDLDRVIRQWLNSFRTSKWAGVITNNNYRKDYTETIRQLVTRGSRIDVACYEASPAMLLGFVCHEHTPRDNILHYVFVRSRYRNLGIGRALMNSAGFPKGLPYVYTFRTPDSNLFSGGRHMPELARRREAFKPDATELDPAEAN